MSVHNYHSDCSTFRVVKVLSYTLFICYQNTKVLHATTFFGSCFVIQESSFHRNYQHNRSRVSLLQPFSNANLFVIVRTTLSRKVNFILERVHFCLLGTNSKIEGCRNRHWFSMNVTRSPTINEALYEQN